MEFKHKLARRLAILRASALLVIGGLLWAACDPADSGGPSQSPDTAFSWGRPKNSGDVPLSVPKPHLVSITIAPDTAMVAPGARQGFSAQGLLRDGNTVKVLVKWSASSGRIDSTGLYSAPGQVGRYHIYASASGLVDSAAVNVAGTPDSLAVSGVRLVPASVTLAAGSTQAFAASAIMSDGSSAPVAVTLTASGGTITAAGLYTAGSSVGTFRVVATTADGLADTSAVTVTLPPPVAASVVLSPATDTVQTGASIQFAATAKMSDGTTGPANVTYAATGGTITSQGRFTAGSKAGSFRVVATTAEGLADTSAVTVTLPPPTLASVVLSPPSDTVQAGATIQFAATSKMSDGTTAPANVTFAATGGTITPQGLFTAGSSAGRFRVVATAVDTALADTAAVTVTTASPTPPTGTGELAATADSFANSVGVNVHLSYTNVYGNYSLIKSLLADVGIKHIRDGGKAFADANWMIRIHGRTKDLNTSLGIKMNYIADAFGDQQNWDFSDTEGIDSVVKYAGAASIESFEGLNEWNSKRSTRPNWAAEVRERQQAIWSHVTSKYPAYRVLGPSFTRYVDACTVGDLSAYMHFGNMHPYPGGRPQTASLQDNISNLRCVNGGDRLVSTETGYQTALASTSGNRAVSERASGKYMPRLYLSAFNTGVLRSYSYELVDEGVSQTDAEASFGLFRNNGSAKPAAVAAKNLLQLLADPGPGFTPGRLNYALSGDLTNLQHTLLQKRDGRFYLALWLEVTSFDLSTMQDVTVPTRPITVTLGPSATWRVYQPNVGSAALASGSGPAVSLNVPDQVVVVEITP